MPFTKAPQTFGSSIKEVTVGTGDKAVVLGGENVMPLCSFDAEIKNRPAVAIEITDKGVDMSLPQVAEFYAGCETIADQAKRACEAEGADMLAVRFEGADPNGDNASTEECVELIKAIAEVATLPIVIEGCKNAAKDAELFDAVANALQGQNALILSATEENYKTVAASAGMAYGQKFGAESAVDINLAKQLNVLIGQMGVAADSYVMNVGTAAAGYGYEYVVSTMDRIELAALEQGDAQLLIPIVTPIASETWAVKEATSEDGDSPEWGPREERGIQMEICTAAATLASGANAVILAHPASVKTVAALVADLM